MAKLVLSVDPNKKEDKENVKTKRSPFSTTQSKKKEVQQTLKSCVNKQSKNKCEKDVLSPKSNNSNLDDLWSLENENSPQFVQGTPVAPPPLSENRRKRTPRSSTV